MKVDVKQLDFVDQLLQRVLIDLEEKMCAEFTGTSIYRIDDDGVHGQLPVRGWDLQCRYEPLAQIIMEYLNTKWVYDEARPHMDVCIWHDTGSGVHLHIQVHFNTKLRG